MQSLWMIMDDETYRDAAGDCRACHQRAGQGGEMAVRPNVDSSKYLLKVSGAGPDWLASASWSDGVVSYQEADLENLRMVLSAPEWQDEDVGN